jgi:hypothetical protein
MIWAVLAYIGVPLWLCAIGIGVLVMRSRRLRGRPGNIPVRVLHPGRTRWVRGHAIWVSDVFAWRRALGGWDEDLIQVVDVRDSLARQEETKKLHRLGEDPALVVLVGAQGETLTVATATAHRTELLGPFSPKPSSSGAAS